MQEKNVDTWESNSLSVKVKDVVGVHLKMEAKHLGVSSQLRKVCNDIFIRFIRNDLFQFTKHFLICKIFSPQWIKFTEIYIFVFFSCTFSLN